MIIVAGTVRIDPTKRDQAMAAAAKAIPPTLAEDGCEAYRFGFDVDDPSLIHVFEQWASEAALAAHFQAPHLAEFLAAFGELGVSETKLDRFDVSAISRVM